MIVCDCRASGFHLMWTHLHLLCSAVILLTNTDGFLLAVVGCIGVMIAIPWYVMLVKNVLDEELFLIHRSFIGWTHWVFAELVGSEAEMDVRRVPVSSYFCFIAPPLHHSTTPPLHHSTTLPLYHSTTPPRHHATTPPRHHATTLPPEQAISRRLWFFVFHLVDLGFHLLPPVS